MIAVFDKIYELADQVEKGNAVELDERARACRTTKEQVLDVKTRLAGVRSELSESWYGQAGKSALDDLDAFVKNRDKQADDLEKSASSFDTVRDALDKAKIEAKDKREEAKKLQEKLDKIWKDVESGKSNTVSAWAEDKIIKAKAAILLADTQRVVTTYDAVLLAEGLKIRRKPGEVWELAGSSKRNPAEIIELVIKGLDGLPAHVAKNPELAKALLDRDWDKLMRDPKISEMIYDYLGFKYVEDGDFYTTGEGSMQSFLGWHDFYDNLEPLIGAPGLDKTSTDGDNMEFTDPETGQQYRLELWKGGYGFGHAFGGEVGIYTRDDVPGDDLGGDLEKTFPGYYSTADEENQLKVTQEIYNKQTGETYFTNDGAGADGDDKKHYWNLGLRTDPNVDAEQLGQRATIEAHNPAMREAMFNEMDRYAKAHPEQQLKVFKDPDNPNALSYTWEQ